MKEINKNLNKQRDIPCPRIGRLNTVKMLVLPNSIYSFNAIPVKIPISNIIGINKLILKFTWKSKKEKKKLIVNTILNRKTKLED